MAITCLVDRRAFFSLAFSAQGDFVATGGDTDGTIILWRASDGQEHRRWTGHRLAISGLAFRSDGWVLASSSEDGIAKLWDLGTKNQLSPNAEQAHAIHSIAFSGDDQRLLLGGSGKTAVVLWDVNAQQELVALEGRGALFRKVVFCPDGSGIAALSTAHELHLWRAPSLQMIASAESAAANQ